MTHPTAPAAPKQETPRTVAQLLDDGRQPAMRPDWKKNLVAANPQTAKEWLCKIQDRGGYDGYERDSWLCAIAQCIEDLEVNIASQIEIANAERAEKERLESQMRALSASRQGEAPVAWAVTWNGEIATGNIRPFRSEAEEIKTRLDKSHPQDEREVVPLYRASRSSAPAELEAWREHGRIVGFECGEVAGKMHVFQREAVQAEQNSSFIVSDGYGNGWTCVKGYDREECQLEVVRPGKVQCNKCDHPAPRESAPEELVKKLDDEIAHENTYENEGERWSVAYVRMKQLAYSLAEALSRPAADREDARRFAWYLAGNRAEHCTGIAKLLLREIGGEHPTLDEWRDTIDREMAALSSEPREGERK